MNTRGHAIINSHNNTRKTKNARERENKGKKTFIPKSRFGKT